LQYTNTVCSAHWADHIKQAVFSVRSSGKGTWAEGKVHHTLGHESPEGE